MKAFGDTSKTNCLTYSPLQLPASDWTRGESAVSDELDTNVTEPPPIFLMNYTRSFFISHHFFISTIDSPAFNTSQHF